jgi:hypothetical protein
MCVTRHLTFLGLVFLLVGCASLEMATRLPPAQPTQSVPGSHPPIPGTELLRDGPACINTSHGCIALNPQVTDANIDRTICVIGYTRTLRPPTTYTNGVKAHLLDDAGLDRSHAGEYELDHIIPLEIGGNPEDPSNLQLQPWYGENSAHEKDGLENKLHNMVCRGEVTLVDTQHCIAEDWHACKAAITAGQFPPSGVPIGAPGR